MRCERIGKRMWCRKEDERVDSVQQLLTAMENFGFLCKYDIVCKL
jgi:hypothetical protein